MRPWAHMKRLVRDESGSAAIEYGLIAALLAIATMAAFASAGGGISVLFDGFTGKANTSLSNASGVL